jgi:hypothetical protein
VSEADVPELVALVEQASTGLGEVEVTRAHGCAALSAAGRPFAVVTADARIGVRLPDWDLFAAAYELPGSDVFYEGGERVGHWVLLPAEVSRDGDALGEWLRHAHALTAGRV